MKLLINTPNLKELGGVANHYIGLRDYWSETVLYNTVGKRGKWKGSGVFWLFIDILKFLIRLFFFRPDFVIINPSLGKNALVRDFIFLRISRLFGFKVTVFFHGFNLEYAKIIDYKWVSKNINRAQLVLVLSGHFKDILKSWGVNIPIHLTTTKIDDKLINSFDVNKRDGVVKNILFLARVEKSKGVYETIETYNLLKAKYPFLTLTIVGDGSELPQVRKYIREHKIDDVRITGGLRSDALIKEYVNADLYLFLSYGEGMPTTVLEAMAFGLPIFTRSVGGLVDFFDNGEMGYISDSLNPKDYFDAIMPYIENPNHTKDVAVYNAKYAKEHFMASKVARNMERLIEKYS